MKPEIAEAFEKLYAALDVVQNQATAIRMMVPSDPKHRGMLSAARNMEWELSFITSKCKRYAKEFSEVS